MQNLEYLAVALAIAYLVLATRQNIWCWFCAFFSSAIYTYIFWDVSLLMESALNIFYVVMAVLGWWQWQYGGNEGEELPVTKLKLWQHGVLISGVLGLALLNGWLMQRYTNAALPFIDAFTTWASVVTTFLVVKKVLENWLYWIVIDSISIYLYLDRGLTLTALLFAGYVLIAIFGFVNWKKDFNDVGQTLK